MILDGRYDCILNGTDVWVASKHSYHVFKEFELGILNRLFVFWYVSDHGLVHRITLDLEECEFWNYKELKESHPEYFI